MMGLSMVAEQLASQESGQIGKNLLDEALVDRIISFYQYASEICLAGNARRVSLSGINNE